MTYVDGFVLPVPRARMEEYRKLSEEASVLFKEFGAIRHVECWEEDVPDGKVTDFRRSVDLKPDEILVFSWIEYPSKDVRDAANQKVMSDPRMSEMFDEMSFDGRRMIYGGFVPFLDR
jgi:uncharacterized protein YbaA (DUF1428 family)